LEGTGSGFCLMWACYAGILSEDTEMK